MKNYAKNRLHSSARFNLMALAGLALALAFFASRVAVAQARKAATGVPTSQDLSTGAPFPAKWYGTTASVGPQQRISADVPSVCAAWQERTPFPPPTAYGGAATSNGTYAYVAGGYSFDTSTALNVFRRFDPVANAWTVLAPMPGADAEASAVYSPVNNKVYVFGGDDPVTGMNSNATRIYDIASNTWSAGANMPDVRSFMASGYYNGKIYLVAGYNTGSVTPQSQVWEYDPVANTFNTTRMPMPHATGGAGFGIINGHLYVAGGRDTSGVIALVYDYDIAANTWTARASLPAPNNVPGSGVVNGQLWLFGGGNPFAFAPTTTNASVFYDPGSDTWSNGPALNEARSFPAGTAVGGTLVAAGGYNGSTSISSTETSSCGTGCTPNWVVRAPVPYNARGPFAVSDGTFVYAGGGYDGSNVHTDLLRYDPVANSWTSLAPSSDSHFLSQAVINNGKIYNIAGFTLGAQTNTTRIYDIATNTWTTGTPLPTMLSDHATALWNGIIYVAGGFNGSGGVNTLYAYNIASNSWTTLAPMPAALYLPGFGAINGKLYIASGNNGAGEVNTLYIYDIASNTWTTGATVPTPVTGPGSTVFNGRLYLYGGGAPFPTTTTITQIYDPGINTWSSGPNMNVNRLWFYGTSVGGGSIVAPGGDQSPGTPINDNERLMNCAPAAQSAFSRKVHGGAGTFDIPLPLTGNVGVECRIGPTYQMIINFASSVTVGSASVTSGTGMVSSFSGSGTSQITVNLTGVTNVQRITVTLHNVNDGTSNGDVPVSMGVLVGDVNGNAVVNASDVAQTKAQVGNPVTSSNFREDVNANGTISATDVALVKSEVGTALPP